MKTRYEEELEKRIANLETKYGYLKQEVEDLEQVEFLEEKIATARKLLSEVKDRGEDAWDDVRDNAEKAWKELEGAFGDLKRRFTKD